MLHQGYYTSQSIPNTNTTGTEQSQQQKCPGFCIWLGIVFVIIERCLFGWGFDINDYEIIADLDDNIQDKIIEYELKEAEYLKAKGWFGRCDAVCVTLQSKYELSAVELSGLQSKRKIEATKVRHETGLWSSFSVYDTRNLFWEDTMWGYDKFMHWNDTVFGLIWPITWCIFAACGLSIGGCAFCCHLWEFTSGFFISGWIYFVITYIATASIGSILQYFVSLIGGVVWWVVAILIGICAKQFMDKNKTY